MTFFTALSEGVLLIAPRLKKRVPSPSIIFSSSPRFIATLTVTLLGGSISQRTDSLALQPETHARDAQDWSLVGASGTLGITDFDGRTGEGDGG